MDRILQHAWDLGWTQCFWSDENLASKKIYPGYQFPCKSKAWTPRVRTSAKSMHLMTLRAHTTQDKSLPCMRKKPDLAEVEGLAERACVVLALAKEVQQTHPNISDNMLQDGWILEWADGSDQIDMEVQAALLEKSETFSPSLHIPTLQKLIDANLFSNPVAPSDAVVEALEVDAFELLMRQLDYDVKVSDVWQKKCKNAHTAKDNAQSEWRLRRNKECKKAAKLYLESCSKLLTWDGNQVEAIIGDIMNFRKDVITKKIAAIDIPALIYLNWAAPCGVPDTSQTMQTGVLS